MIGNSLNYTPQKKTRFSQPATQCAHQSKRKQSSLRGRLACRAGWFKSLDRFVRSNNVTRCGAQRQKLKRCFDQLHFAVLLAVQDLYPALHVAEHEHVPVTELALLYRLLERKWLVGHGVRTLGDMSFCEFDVVRKRMHFDRDSTLEIAAHGDCQ